MMPHDLYTYVKAALLSPLSPDYVPGPKHPPSPAYLPEFVLKPAYSEFKPPKDDLLLAEEQPLPATEESFIDDANDEEQGEDEKGEEQPALAKSILPPPVHRTTARISIPTQAHVPFLSKAEEFPRLHYHLGNGYALLLDLNLRLGIVNLLLLLGLLEALEQIIVLLALWMMRLGKTQKDVSYGITYTWDEMVEDMQKTPSTIDVAGLSYRMTDFVTTVRQDTNEIYGRLHDAQDDRLLMSSQLNMLHRDRYSHARTARLMKSKADFLARLGYSLWMPVTRDSRDAKGPAHPDVPKKEPIEDQPLPADASPTALSLSYVVDSDPKKDEKDPKEDPADYPADRGDNDDDESSNDDDDVDDVEKDEEDKEEEEHLALANPSDVSTDDLVPSS
nr:hypothetical protein [Tanacetum cinerariifolium]